MTPEASEFVILTPEPAHKALVYSRSRLRAYLAVRFPDFRFSLARMAGSNAAEEFVVVPVVGEVGGDAAQEFHVVNDATLGEIRDALEAFDLHASLLH